MKGFLVYSGGFMKRFSILFPVLIILSLLLSMSAWSGGAFASTSSQPTTQDDYQRYIVRFKQGVAASRIAQLHQNAGGQFESSISQIGAQVIRIPRSSIVAKLAAYRNFAEVDFIEPDYIANVVETPNDSQFDFQ
jgi:hypothetical protein